MSGVAHGPIVIQVATPPEFQAMHQALGAPTIEKAGKRQFFVSGERIVLRGAVGKVWAAASAEFAIARWAPSLVIDFGAAGGLVPGLRVGDIVVAEKVIEHDSAAIDGNRNLAPEGLSQALAEVGKWLEPEAWLRKVPRYPDFISVEGVRACSGAVASGDKDIVSVEERAALASRHDAIAATWESAAVGRIARFHGVSYLSVRVITDLGAPGASHDEVYAEYKKGVARALPPAAAALVGLLKGR